MSALQWGHESQKEMDKFCGPVGQNHYQSQECLCYVEFMEKVTKMLSWNQQFLQERFFNNR